MSWCWLWAEGCERCDHHHDPIDTPMRRRRQRADPTGYWPAWRGDCRLPRSICGYLHALCAYIRMIYLTVVVMVVSSGYDVFFCDQVPTILAPPPSPPALPFSPPCYQCSFLTVSGPFARPKDIARDPGPPVVRSKVPVLLPLPRPAAGQEDVVAQAGELQPGTVTVL